MADGGYRTPAVTVHELSGEDVARALAEFIAKRDKRKMCGCYVDWTPESRNGRLTGAAMVRVEWDR